MLKNPNTPTARDQYGLISTSGPRQDALGGVQAPRGSYGDFTPMPFPARQPQPVAMPAQQAQQAMPVPARMQSSAPAAPQRPAYTPTPIEWQTPQTAHRVPAPTGPNPLAGAAGRLQQAIPGLFQPPAQPQAPTNPTSPANGQPQGTPQQWMQQLQQWMPHIQQFWPEIQRMIQQRLQMGPGSAPPLPGGGASEPPQWLRFPVPMGGPQDKP